LILVGLLHRVISLTHIAMDILFKFDLGNESDYTQDHDLFLYLTQSRFVSIVAQFMIITAVDGCDHYLILSVDCVTLSDRSLWRSLVDAVMNVLFDHNRNSLSILVFD
jgi:hypothetical protein